MALGRGQAEFEGVCMLCQVAEPTGQSAVGAAVRRGLARRVERTLRAATALTCVPSLCINFQSRNASLRLPRGYRLPPHTGNPDAPPRALFERLR